MNTKKKRIIGIMLSPILLCSAQATIVISDLDTTYSQDFSVLPSLGTDLFWTNNVTIDGWYREYDGSIAPPGRDVSVQADGTGGSGVVSEDGFINCGQSNSTDRCVVMRRNFSFNGATGMVLQNDSGTNSIGFSLGYTGEQWRRQGEEATSLYLEYAVVASHDESTFDILDDYTWTRVDALEFVSPRTGSPSGLNGDSGINREIITPVFVPAAIADGHYLAIRWFQDRSNTNGNSTTSRHALGVNDMSVKLEAEIATAPEGQLVIFDFENATPGDLLQGGVLGTNRNVSTGFGSGFDYTHNGPLPSNLTASVLGIVDAGGGTDYNVLGANVREDVITGDVPGGNYIEFSPHRMQNQAFGAELYPTGTVDYLNFSVEASSGKVVSVESIIYDLAIGNASTNDWPVELSAQGWFSTDSGASWTRMGDPTSITNAAPTNFTGFTSFTTDVSVVSGLQNVSGELLIAVSIGDNSSRNLYQISGASPAGFYLDNLTLRGEVTEPPAVVVITDFAVEGGNVLVTWDSVASYDYNVSTNLDLSGGSWGVTDTVPGTGGSVTWTSAVPAVSENFYKVDLVNP